MRARLGDDIDDFCVKCKRVMNHSVVSLLNDEPAKVRCRTCHSDHDYRHEQAPPPKVDPRKAALFDQVLEKVTGEAKVTGEPAAAAPPPPKVAPPQPEMILAAPEVVEAVAAKPKARKKVKA